MEYRNGDKVRIKTLNTTHTGETGRVVNAYTDNVSLLVRLDVSGQDIGFFTSEVEIVWSDEELAHIEGIKTALKNKEPQGWNDEDYQAVAESLFRDGVRYNV